MVDIRPEFSFHLQLKFYILGCFVHTTRCINLDYHFEVYAGDEFDEYVPPFSFKLNAAGDGVVEDGTPLHAILFLVHKQPGRWIVRPDNYVKTTRRAVCYALTKKKCIFRIDFQGGQWGCEPKLGMRVTNKVDWTILLTTQILK